MSGIRSWLGTYKLIPSLGPEKQVAPLRSLAQRSGRHDLAAATTLCCGEVLSAR